MIKLVAKGFILLASGCDAHYIMYTKYKIVKIMGIHNMVMAFRATY